MSGTKVLKTDVEEWLKPILDREGLTNYTVEISGSSEKGEGFLGDITFVDVRSEKKTYNFVLKSGKKSKDLREAMPTRQAFQNEIFVYDEIFPAYVEFQKERGVKDPFDNVAKCYGTLVLEEMEVLVLDNLKERGFSLHSRYEPMNKEHIRTIIKCYGKLHAISYAIRDQKPDLLKKLSEPLVDVMKSFTETFKPPEDYNVYQIIIDLAKEENDEAVVAKANQLNELYMNSGNITDPSDPYAVLIHGDCWNNNFMFKYKDDGTISDLRFLDFQISRLASPVYDLSYFLFTCLSEEDVENFDEINNLYYETLSNSLREMGSDPAKIFPYEELLKQWKKFSLFGLVMLPGTIKNCVQDQDEVPDLEEAAKKNNNFEEMFSTSLKNREQYRKRTLPVMRLAARKQFAE